MFTTFGNNDTVPQNNQLHSSASAPIFGSIPEGAWVRSGEEDTAPLDEFVDIISGRSKARKAQLQQQQEQFKKEQQEKVAANSMMLLNLSTDGTSSESHRSAVFATLNLMGSSMNNNSSQNPNARSTNSPASQSQRSGRGTPKHASSSINIQNTANTNKNTLSPPSTTTDIEQRQFELSRASHRLLEIEDEDSLTPEELVIRKKLLELDANEKLLTGVDDLVAKHHLYKRRPALRNVQDDQPGFYVRAKFELSRDKDKLRPPTPYYVVMQRLLKTKLSTFSAVIYSIWFVIKVRKMLLKTEVQERILGRLKEGEVQRAAKARVLAKKFYGASTRSMNLHVVKQRTNMKEILKDGVKQSERRLNLTKYDRKAGCSHEDEEEEEEDDEQQQRQQNQEQQQQHHSTKRSKYFQQSSKNARFFRSKNDPFKQSQLFKLRVKPKEDHLFDRSKYNNSKSGTELPMYLRRTSFVNIIDGNDGNNNSSSSRRQSQSQSHHERQHTKFDLAFDDGADIEVMNEKSMIGSSKDDEYVHDSSEQRKTRLGEILFADKEQSSSTTTTPTKNNNNVNKSSPVARQRTPTNRNPFIASEFIKRREIQQKKNNAAKKDDEEQKQQQEEEQRKEGEHEESDVSETERQQIQMDDKHSLLENKPHSTTTTDGTQNNTEERSLLTFSVDSLAPPQPEPLSSSTAADKHAASITSLNTKIQSSLKSKAHLDKLPMTKNIFLWHFCWKDEEFVPPHPSLPSLASSAERLGLMMQSSSPSSPLTPATGQQHRSSTTSASDRNTNNTPSTSPIKGLKDATKNLSITLRERDATKYVTQVRSSELSVFAMTKEAPDLVDDLAQLQNCFASNHHDALSSPSSPKKNQQHQHQREDPRKHQQNNSNRAMQEAEVMLKRSVNLGRSVPATKETANAHHPGHQTPNRDHQYHTNTPRKPAVPALGKRRRASARKEAIIASKTSATFEPFALHFGMEHSSFVRRSMQELARQIESHRDIYEQKRELLMEKDSYNRRYQAHLQHVDHSVRKRLTDQCDDEIKQYCMDWFVRLKTKVSQTMSGGLNEYMEKVFDAFEPVFKTGILTPQIFEKTAVLKLYGRHLLEKTTNKNSNKNSSGVGGSSNSNNNNTKRSGITSVSSTSATSDHKSSTTLLASPPPNKNTSNVTVGSVAAAGPPPKRGAAYFASSTNSNNKNKIIIMNNDDNDQQQVKKPTPPPSRNLSTVSPLATPTPTITSLAPSGGNQRRKSSTSPIVRTHSNNSPSSTSQSSPLQQDEHTTGLSLHINNIAAAAGSTTSFPSQLTPTATSQQHQGNNNNNFNISTTSHPDPFKIPVFDGLLVAPTNEECVLVDMGAQFVLMRLRIPFEVSQEKAKEIIVRSGANYALMEADDVDQIYRHETRVGKARVQRIGKLDEVIDRNNRIEKMVEEGRKLAEKRIAEKRHLRSIVGGSTSANNNNNIHDESVHSGNNNHTATVASTSSGSGVLQSARTPMARKGSPPKASGGLFLPPINKNSNKHSQHQTGGGSLTARK